MVRHAIWADGSILAGLHVALNGATGERQGEQHAEGDKEADEDTGLHHHPHSAGSCINGQIDERTNNCFEMKTKLNLLQNILQGNAWSQTSTGSSNEPRDGRQTGSCFEKQHQMNNI